MSTLSKLGSSLIVLFATLSLCPLGSVLTPSAFAYNPELRTLDLSDCVSPVEGCQVCYHFKHGKLIYDSYVSCPGPDLSSKPQIGQTSLAPYPENFSSTTPSTLSEGTPAQFKEYSSIAAQGLAQVLSYATRPNPYKAFSKAIDAEIAQYKGQIVAQNAELRSRHDQRVKEWKEGEIQLHEALSNLSLGFQEKTQSAKTQTNHYDFTLSKITAAEPGFKNPTIDFLNRAVSSPRNLSEVAAKVSPKFLSPDSVSLGDTWTQVLAQRLKQNISPAQARVEQERARLKDTASSPLRKAAQKALEYADRFASGRGRDSQDLSEILRQEARALRHQAEGKILPNPNSAPLTQWMKRFDGSSELRTEYVTAPSIENQLQVISAFSNLAFSNLNHAKIATQLDSNAVSFLRGQIGNAQKLTRSGAYLAHQDHLGAAKLGRTLIDLAYSTVVSVNSFSENLILGTYNGLYSTGEVIQTLLTQPAAWDPIVAGVLLEISQSPVDFVKKGLEPFIDYAYVMANGSAAEKGLASGNFIAQTLVASTLGAPLESLADAALRSTVDAGIIEVRNNLAGQVAGNSIAFGINESPAFTRLKSGILTEYHEIEAYFDGHSGLAALPSELRPKQVLVGAFGRDEKVALIGRSMEGGVYDAKQVLEGHGINVKTFEPSHEAYLEFKNAIQNYRLEIGDGSARLPYDRVKLTQSYRENQAWIQELKKEGYTILDIGNPKQISKASAFYDVEIDTVFPKKSDGTLLINFESPKP